MVACIVSFCTLALQNRVDQVRGFREVSRAAFFAKDHEFSFRDYQVSLKDDRLIVETRESYVKREEPELGKKLPPDPHALIIKLQDATLEGPPGGGLKVDGGSLVPADAGEFGGGLFLVAPDGKSYRMINDRNTPMLAKIGKGIYAVQSLSHMGLEYSHLVEVVRTSNGWTVREVKDLHKAPDQILQDGDHFVCAYRDSVKTLDIGGTLQELVAFKPAIYIGSMVVRKNGDIWISSLNGVVELVKKSPGQYIPVWYLPNR